MYSHHIEEMVESVMGSFGYTPPVNEDEKAIQAEEREKIKKGIEACWVDKIAVSWSAGDILSYAEEDGISLTKDEALDILNGLLENHDAGIGINWDVISMAIQEHKS